LAVHISDTYLVWRDEKLKLSEDQYLRMDITFVKLMDMYRLFRLSVSAGDAIMIEWLYKVRVGLVPALPTPLVVHKTSY
jgi:hypothetical protein